MGCATKKERQIAVDISENFGFIQIFQPKQSGFRGLRSFSIVAGTHCQVLQFLKTLGKRKFWQKNTQVFGYNTSTPSKILIRKEKSNYYRTDINDQTEKIEKVKKDLDLKNTQTQVKVLPAQTNQTNGTTQAKKDSVTTAFGMNFFKNRSILNFKQ